MSLPFKYPRECVLLPVADLDFGDRVRTNYTDMESLANSITSYGLLHPPTVNYQNRLIAGGRRTRVMIDLLKCTHIPVVYLETLDEAHLQILEDEENVRRVQPRWQDRVISIQRVHSSHAVSGSLIGNKWTTEQTGELLGMSRANISYALTVATAIRAGDKEIMASESITEAYRILCKRKELEFTRSLAASSAMILPPDAIKAAPSQSVSVTDAHGAAPEGFSSPADFGFGLGDFSAPTPTPAVPVVGPTFNLSGSFFCGDSIEWMHAHPGCCDHIITDIPYGIDMANLSQQNTGMDVSTTAAEHDVEDNLAMFELMFPAMHCAMRSVGFAVLWCDFQHWSKLCVLATEAGFAVQRWPLIWNKSSPCLNQAAQYNFTKNCEVALVLRKGGATLVEAQKGQLYTGPQDASAIYGHPFAKPLNLWKWVYKAVSLRGQTVLDPFAGSGTASIAALDLGLTPLGVELNPDNHSRLMANVRTHLTSINPATQFC
jgi:DNA modification methylase